MADGRAFGVTAEASTTLLRAAADATMAYGQLTANIVDISELKYGRCYSNGIYGNRWAVYQITREHEDGSLSFKIVAGAGRRKTERWSREDFARWAKYEVALKENEWVKLTTDRARAPE